MTAKLLYFQNHFNFTYEIVPPPDGNYGIFDEKTQQWNGMIRMAKDRQIDASKINQFREFYLQIQLLSSGK